MRGKNDRFPFWEFSPLCYFCRVNLYAQTSVKILRFGDDSESFRLCITLTFTANIVLRNEDFIKYLETSGNEYEFVGCMSESATGYISLHMNIVNHIISSKIAGKSSSRFPV